MKCDQDKVNYDKDNDEQDKKDENEVLSLDQGYGREREKGERGAS